MANYKANNVFTVEGNEIVAMDAIEREKAKTGNQELHQSLKTLFLYMRFFGLYFVPDSDEKILNISEKYWKLYSFLLVIYTWFVSLIPLPVAFASPETNFSSFCLLITICSCVLLMAIGISSYFLFNYSGEMQDVVQLFSQLQNGDPKHDELWKNCFRFLRVCGAIASGVTLFMSTSLICLLYSTRGNLPNGFQIDAIITTLPYHMNIPVRCIYCFSVFFLITMFTLQIFFIFASCLIFQYGIKILNLETKERIFDAKGSNSQMLRTHMQSMTIIYRDISKNVNMLNDAFGFLMLAYVFQGGVTVCSTIYFVLHFCQNRLTTYIEYSIAWYAFCALAGFLSGISFVHTEAQTTQHLFYKAKLMSLSSETLSTMVRFDILLNHKSFAVSLMGFAEITRNFVLSLISTYLTYLSYMFQYSPEQHCEFESEIVTYANITTS